MLIIVIVIVIKEIYVDNFQPSVVSRRIWYIVNSLEFKYSFKKCFLNRKLINMIIPCILKFILNATSLLVFLIIYKHNPSSI